MPLDAEKGKVQALDRLEKRREANKDKKRINNSSLPAGSPMYYYCKICGEEMVLPEDHDCNAPSKCDECQILVDFGWLE